MSRELKALLEVLDDVSYLLDPGRATRSSSSSSSRATTKRPALDVSRLAKRPKKEFELKDVLPEFDVAVKLERLEEEASIEYLIFSSFR